MPRCPNCGRETERTEDWACKWCGYPLLSGGYRKIAKTYRQLQAERTPAPPPVAEAGQPQAAVPERKVRPAEKPAAARPARPAPEPEPELEPELEDDLEPEPEPEEPEMDAELIMDAEPVPEAELELEPEPGPEPETEPEPEPEPEPKQVARADAVPAAETPREAVPAPAAVPDWGTETAEGVIRVAVEGLSAAFQADTARAQQRFEGKVLQVTGVVEKVMVRDTLEIFYLLLGGKRPVLWHVRGVFEREHALRLQKLRPGEEITIQGKYAGYERNILLKGCTLLG